MPPRQPSRDLEALRLKAQGYTIEEIADYYGLTGPAANNKVTNMIKRGAAAALRWPVEELREVELKSLDELEDRLWRKLERQNNVVSNGRQVFDESGAPIEDVRAAYEAADRILRVKERRAKLLGLDAPTKSEVITIDAIDKQIAQLEEMLKKNDRAKAPVKATVSQAEDDSRGEAGTPPAPEGPAGEAGGSGEDGGA